MSKCPKVKPYDPHHLSTARDWLHNNFVNPTPAQEKSLACVLGRVEESGWNMAMYKLRDAMTNLTLVLTPTLWDYTLQRFATKARAEAREKAKAKKGR